MKIILSPTQLLDASAKSYTLKELKTTTTGTQTWETIAYNSKPSYKVKELSSFINPRIHDLATKITAKIGSHHNFSMKFDDYLISKEHGDSSYVMWENTFPRSLELCLWRLVEDLVSRGAEDEITLVEYKERIHKACERLESIEIIPKI